MRDRKEYLLGLSLTMFSVIIIAFEAWFIDWHILLKVSSATFIMFIIFEITSGSIAKTIMRAQRGIGSYENLFEIYKVDIRLLQQNAIFFLHLRNIVLYLFLFSTAGFFIGLVAVL